MKNIIFEGFIGDKYGREWNIVAKDLRDVICCLEANYPEARKDLIDFAESGGAFSIQTGEDFLDEETMYYSIKEDTIIITPIPAGAKSGAAKVVGAIALIAFAIFMPQIVAFAAGQAGLAGAATAANMGLTNTALASGAFSFTQGSFLAYAQGMALNSGIALGIMGLMQIMAPDPSVDTNDQNYLFSGPENTIATGAPVPILFGEMIVGGVVINSGTVGGLHRNFTAYVESPDPTLNGTPVTGTNGMGSGGSISIFNNKDPSTTFGGSDGNFGLYQAVY